VHRICNCFTDQIHHGGTIAYGHYTSVTTIRGALYLFDDAHVRSADVRDLLHPNVVAVVLRRLSAPEVAALPVVAAPAVVVAAPAVVVAAPAPSVLRTAVGTSVVVEVRQGDWRTCAQGSAVVSPSNALFRHRLGLALDIDQCAGTAYVHHCATLGTLTDSRVQVTAGFK
jgi:hypothetical protein